MSKNLRKQIMISYNWEHQEEVKQIKEALEERGYRIWIDLHNMKGDINKAMAEGVEKSSVVLLCVTEAYKNSHNCKKEANYADDLRKNIIPLKLEKDVEFLGWIGPVVGGKLWFDFSNFKYFKDSINGLDEELRNLRVQRYGKAAGSDLDQPLSTLGVDGVCDWLQSLEIDDATITIFRDNCVTGDDLEHITHNELIGDEFKVRSFVAKKIIRNRDKCLVKTTSSVVKSESETASIASVGTGAVAKTDVPTRVSNTIHVHGLSALTEVMLRGVEGVCKWLKDLNIDDDTVTIFQSNRVTGDDLKHITQEELVGDDFEVQPAVAKKIVRNRDICSAKVSRTVLARGGKEFTEEEEREEEGGEGVEGEEENDSEEEKEKDSEEEQKDD